MQVKSNSKMLNRNTVVQECDATGAEVQCKAGLKKNKFNVVNSITTIKLLLCHSLVRAVLYAAIAN